jgi:hypothetical protein
MLITSNTNRSHGLSHLQQLRLNLQAVTVFFIFEPSWISIAIRTPKRIKQPICCLLNKTKVSLTMYCFLFPGYIYSIQVTLCRLQRHKLIRAFKPYNKHKLMIIKSNSKQQQQ